MCLACLWPALPSVAVQYLIGATVIAAAWALVMLLLDCISLGRGKLSDSRTPKILRIIGDFVSALLLQSCIALYSFHFCH